MPNTSTTDEGKALSAKEEADWRMDLTKPKFFRPFSQEEAKRIFATVDAARAERDAAFAAGRAEGVEEAYAAAERAEPHCIDALDAIRALLPSPAVGGKEDLGDGRWADVDPAALQKAPSND